MKPVHILTSDSTAGVLAEQIKTMGTQCTWGPVVSPSAKYVVTPNAPAGEAQADRLTAGDVMRGVFRSFGSGEPYQGPLFSVEIRRVVAEVQKKEAPQPASRPQQPTLVSPAEQKVIQVDVTDACQRACSNCTRFCGHSAKPFYMAPAKFREAVDSLSGYKGMVGVMGGEPTLHPRFAELATYINTARPDPDRGPRKYAACVDWGQANSEALSFRNWRKGLWTGLGPGYKRHYELIQDTFRYQCVNDHRGGCGHQALLVPRKELGIPDAEWLKYRNACWVQHLWSATVTPRGAYFCEVAAALAKLFHGPDGWPIEPEWWKRGPGDFGDQLELCELCSACLPMPSQVDADETDLVSPEMAARLKGIGSTKKIQVVTDDWETLKAKYKAVDSCEPYLAGSDHTRVHLPHGLEIGAITGVVVCKGYDDYLKLTLPRMVQEIRRVIVVTAESDVETRELAAKHGAEVFLSKAIEGEAFAKGTAIAECLATLPSRSWIVLLDADIILPHGWGTNIAQMVLNPGALYYAERRGPPLADWKAAPAVAKVAIEATTWVPAWEMIGDRMYVQKKPWGYCQVFNIGSSVFAGRDSRYPSSHKSAEGDDAIFAHHWYGIPRCVPLPDPVGVVIHLPHGVARGNWNGRRSPRIDDDRWCMDDPSLWWRISYRSGVQFSGLWQFMLDLPLGPGAIIEIGTMLGDGASVMAAAMPGRRIITIDPGPNARCLELAEYRLSFWKNVERWTMTSMEGAARVSQEGIQVAMVYIDGEHTEAGVRSDIETWMPLLKPGALITGHDYGNPTWPGVKAAVDAILGTPERLSADLSWMFVKKEA